MSNKRGSGMRSSLSADDVGSSAKKPGKLSAEFLAKFESDSGMGGSTGALTKRLSHASSSDVGSPSASHEHLQSIKPHVKISEPVPRSEETAAGADKPEKKRKSLWKWKPLKKMRRFFSRKRKSSRRTKSFEDLRTESNRPKSGSDVRQHERLSPVVRTSTMPTNKKAPVVRELRQRQGSSSDDLSASSDTFASKTRSLPVLTSPGQLRDYESTSEAGVSFEDDPNSSSLEGLQAAHDKIKLAPKRRRPPSRKSGSATSSLSTDSSVRNEQITLHRRSKTDPQDLTRDRLDRSLESTSLSDILNNTIFEEEETAKSQAEPSERKSIDERKAAMDDITSRAKEALARASGPPKVGESEVESKPKENANELDKSSLTKSDSSAGASTDKDVKKGSELLKTESGVKNYSEQIKPDTSGPSKFTEREIKAAPSNEESNRILSSKTDTSSPKLTSPKSSEVKREFKRHSLDANMTTNFTETVVGSKSESDILRAEFTRRLLQRESCEKPLRDNKTSGESNQEKSSNKTQPPTTPNKRPQKSPKPFLRGKSLSNKYTPKLMESPSKQDKNEAKKESINNNNSQSEENQKENEESTAPFSEKKDFRFIRTKSWSMGMKPGDTRKANEGSKGIAEDTEGSSGDVQETPSWVAKANRMSQRISQLIQDDETSKNQTPTLQKKLITKDPESTKLKSPPNPVAEDPVKHKPVTKKPLPDKDSKPTESSPKPAPRPKPSNFVRSSASLPRIGGSTANLETKPTSISGKNHSKTINKTTEPAKSLQQVARSSFEKVKIEKCIVCGTTVYQMEKCKFDNSVLHRNCMKCSICKRHLTVGNFVMTESKIYCKPHSRAVVAVST